MGIAAILFNDAKPFEHIPFNTKSHVKSGEKFSQTVSEKKTYKAYTILYKHAARGKGG